MTEDNQPQEEKEKEEEATFIPNSNHSIAIHSILHNAQQSHGGKGLGVNNSGSTNDVVLTDYTQYRNYLTRRLSRIRHAKPVFKALTHGPKSKRESMTTTTTTTTTSTSNTKQRKGGKHSFNPRDPITTQQMTLHPNYILDMIYTIERDWVHGLELKLFYQHYIAIHSTSNNTNSNTIHSNRTISLKKKNHTSPGKVRQHYLNKMKKAFHNIQLLENVVIVETGSVCDDQTCNEIKCYIAWMKGNYYCEIHNWKDACVHYALAFKLCLQLAKSTKSTSSTFDLQPAIISNNNNDKATTITTTIPPKPIAEALQQSDFFISRATNDIQPLLRFCKYELTQQGILSKEEITNICHIPTFNIVDGAEEEVDDDDDVMEHDLLDEKKKGDEIDADDDDSNNSTTINFRGKTIKVEESNIKMSLVRIKNMKEKLKSSSTKTSKQKKSKASLEDAAFMTLLNVYDDAVSMVSKNLKDYEGMVSGPSVNKKRSECLLLLGYLKYSKIQMLMGRNEKMVNELRNSDGDIIPKKIGGSRSSSNSDVEDAKSSINDIHEDVDAKYKRVEEIAHLYDALLQDAKAIVTLPGDKLNDEDDVEDEFILQANANVLRIRALRCYYIGRMYAADKVAKYDEAVALFDQAAMLASEAAEEIAACQDMGEADELIESMADLQNEINAVQIRTKASSFLASRGSNASSATSGLTLLGRLDDFDSGGMTYRIADVPPSLKPIPCKPAFFDVANNYVSTFPTETLEAYVRALEEGKNTKKKGGFLTSWFG